MKIPNGRGLIRSAFVVSLRKGAPARPHDLVRLPSPKREDPSVPSANPLALDPYGPILPTRGSPRSQAAPLALAPYSPIPRARTRSDWPTG